MLCQIIVGPQFQNFMSLFPLSLVTEIQYVAFQKLKKVVNHSTLVTSI